LDSNPDDGGVRMTSAYEQRERERIARVFDVACSLVSLLLDQEQRMVQPLNVMDTSDDKVHQRPKRVCKTPNCYTKPQSNSDYCLACQLDGKAPQIRVPRAS
jgi:hypothetical protein